MGDRHVQIHGSNLFRWLIAFSNTNPVDALPIRRGISIDSVNSASDAWAEALSGVGPLILLIGERNTKQLLRDIRGTHGILSLAFAPLGLLCVLTSMIRLCGSQSLRSFLGYEHEPRTNAALEVTAANCGGIHAGIVEGYLTRATSPDPPCQALAVALLQGTSEDTIREAITQIKSCRSFQSVKRAKGCPEEVGNVHWCFKMTFPATISTSWSKVANLICGAMDIDKKSDISNVEKTLTLSAPQPTPSITGEPSSIDPPTPLATSTGVSLSPGQYNPQKGIELSSLGLPSPLKVSFFATFDGVSELSASPGTPKALTFSIALLSLLAILTLQIICLWQKKKLHVGWLMVILGYFGMSAGVTATTYLIYSSCDTVTLPMQVHSKTANWVHGLVLAVKNTDSLDTTGSHFLQSKDGTAKFEAVWLKDQGSGRHFATWTAAIFLSLSFICHYLGLRSSKWWLSVGELLVCLIAAFARSMHKTRQVQYEMVDGIALDKRCYSTGILDVQKSSRIEKKQRTDSTVDVRMYSLHSSGCLPQTSELVAWRAANICLKNEYLANRILSITGMKVSVIHRPGEERRSVIVSMKGGIVTESGIAFPNVQMGLAFPTSLGDLAAPTPLLSRAAMRQAQWCLEYPHVVKETLPFMGGTYISSFDSLITWWTIAEDRNDMGDQHKNLHGSFVLINTAFFLCLLREYKSDSGLMDAIKDVHKGSTAEDEKFAGNLVNFFSKELVD